MSTTTQAQPLADRVRPKTLDQFIGQKHLVGKGKPLYLAITQNRIYSMIFWGPPGVGKTTCSFFRPGSDEVLFASTHLDPEALKKQQNEIAFIASGKTRRYPRRHPKNADGL